jgi:hypothetical protein
MTRHDFARALGFAVLAAALSLPVLLLGAYAWGYEASLTSYLLLLTPISLFVAARDLRAGVRVVLLSGAIAVILMCSVSRVETAVLGAIVSLAIGRSLLGGPRPIASVLAAELGLGALTFSAFAAFHDQHLIGDALAVWAFWLIQSGFALITHSTPEHEPDQPDPFEAARTAAERLLQS